MLLNIIIGAIVIVLTVITKGCDTVLWLSNYDKVRSRLDKYAFGKGRCTKNLISTAIFRELMKKSVKNSYVC